MTNGIEEVDQEALSTIKRHAGLGMVLGIGIVIAGVLALTLFLAVYFVADGVIEIIWSFRLRPIKGWGWTLFSGVAALVLGIMIWRQFPVSGAWAVGTITGIHMILAGSAIALLSRAARRDAKEAQAT